MLVNNWQEVLMKAWSVRLMIVGSLTIFIQDIMPAIPGDSDLYKVLGGSLVVLAAIARVIKQASLEPK